ncbi:hypothetical protein KKI17_01775 [Patescibacteria group bacterium]|nr:hypothetical protein [Patescibacteria group bacterium]
MPTKKVGVRKPATKEKLIGKVSHYFDKLGVAAIKLSAPLKKGDTVRIEGGDVSVRKKVVSLQKDHKTVAEGKKGDEVGVKIGKKVREGYRVYKSLRPTA